MVLRLILCLSVLASVCNAATVYTTHGPIKGTTTTYNNDESYYNAFLGVRYAQPPVDELRFKAPQPMKKWAEPIDVSENGNVCPQYDISTASARGDEDCLNLNIYTPKIDSKKRAVVVHFHGGAFIMGGNPSYFYGPEYLIKQDVVVVVVNYRLGAFGFLTTEDTKKETANNGIKDQIAALKWIKANVEKFGGDPTKVTLMGHEAGAASASILALSPQAEGLFSKVIAMSGNALCDQFMQKDYDETARELVGRFDCEYSSSTGKDILACLKTKSQQDIIKASNELFMFFSFPRWFGPIVDGYILPDTPEAILLSGNFEKIPFIIGQTKDEGGFYYRLFLNFFNNADYDDNFIDHKLPRILPVVSEFKTKLYPITRAVRKRYFVNVDLESEDEFRPRFVEFLTDLLSTRCVDRFAKHLSKHSVPAYRYVFDYRGQHSVVNLQGENVDMGAVQGDDLQYLLSGIWGNKVSLSPDDIKFSREIYVPLLMNFAKTGVPTPELTDAIKIAWPPITSNPNTVYHINNKCYAQEEFKQDILKFWNEDIAKLLTKKKATKSGKKKDEL